MGDINTGNGIEAWSVPRTDVGRSRGQDAADDVCRPAELYLKTSCGYDCRWSWDMVECEKMPDVSPIGSPKPVTLNRPDRAGDKPSVAAPPPTRGSDKVELSQAAQYLSKLQQMPEVRQELVDRVKREIAAGTYDTPDKIDALLEELAEDLEE
jgi:negative regulator of flagellin synthesis FlgM